MRVLFVCSRNRKRSPTAESVFSGYPGLEVSSAGTSVDAENPISSDQVEWADLLFVMEEVHHRRLKERFSDLLRQKRVIVLRIPDRYAFMEDRLVTLLQQKVTPSLPR